MTLRGRLFRLTSMLAFVTVALACARPRDIPGRIEQHVVDFGPFQERGFLITPEPYQGDYDGMGYIEISFRPPVRAKEIEGRGVHGSAAVKYEVEKVNFERALETLYEQAVKLGADGIMKFEMRSTTFIVGLRSIDGLILSGFAIKRKGAFD